MNSANRWPSLFLYRHYLGSMSFPTIYIYIDMYIHLFVSTMKKRKKEAKDTSSSEYKNKKKPYQAIRSGII